MSRGNRWIFLPGNRSRPRGGEGAHTVRPYRTFAVSAGKAGCVIVTPYLFSVVCCLSVRSGRRGRRPLRAGAGGERGRQGAVPTAGADGERGRQGAVPTGGGPCLFSKSFSNCNLRIPQFLILTSYFSPFTSYLLPVDTFGASRTPPPTGGCGLRTAGCRPYGGYGRGTRTAGCRPYGWGSLPFFKIILKLQFENTTILNSYLLLLTFYFLPLTCRYVRGVEDAAPYAP